MKKPIAMLLCMSLLACMSSTSVFAADESFPLENEETVSEEISSDELVTGEEIVPEAVSSGVPDETEVFGPTEGDLANFAEDESASEEEPEELEEESQELKELEEESKELEESEEDPEESNLSGELELSDEVLEPDREIEPIEEALTYSVSVTWTNMYFTYHPKSGTWDPTEYKYDNGKPDYWAAGVDGGKGSCGEIKLESNTFPVGVNNLNVTFSFSKNSNFSAGNIDMKFTEDEGRNFGSPMAYTADLTRNKTSTTVYATMAWQGALQNFGKDADLGILTLTLTHDQSKWNDPSTPEPPGTE